MQTVEETLNNKLARLQKEFDELNRLHELFDGKFYSNSPQMLKDVSNNEIVIQLRKYIKENRGFLYTNVEIDDGWGRMKDYFENMDINEVLRRVNQNIENDMQEKASEINKLEQFNSGSQKITGKEEREIVCDAMFDLLKDGLCLNKKDVELYGQVAKNVGKNFDNVKATIYKAVYKGTSDQRFIHPLREKWMDRQSAISQLRKKTNPRKKQ